MSTACDELRNGTRLTEDSSRELQDEIASDHDVLSATSRYLSAFYDALEFDSSSDKGQWTLRLEALQADVVSVGKAEKIRHNLQFMSFNLSSAVVAVEATIRTLCELLADADTATSVSPEDVSALFVAMVDLKAKLKEQDSGSVQPRKAKQEERNCGRVWDRVPGTEEYLGIEIRFDPEGHFVFCAEAIVPEIPIRLSEDEKWLLKVLLKAKDSGVATQSLEGPGGTWIGSRTRRSNVKAGLARKLENLGRSISDATAERRYRLIRSVHQDNGHRYICVMDVL